MKIEELNSMWSEDSQIDSNNIVEESVKAIRLHSKYYQVYISEKLKLTKQEIEFNKLQLLKYEYYAGELDKETLDEMGWKPCKKLILKTNIAKYIEADKEVIENQLRISLQKEKVAMLKDIINNISQRTFHIKNIIEAKKFEYGG